MQGAPEKLPPNWQPPWLKAMFRGYFQMAFGEVSVRGLDQIPAKGPLIIASTHRSYLDPLILGGFISRPFSARSKRDLFSNPLFARLITKLGAFPVDREKTRNSTFRTAVQILRKGDALVIFPEGGIVNSLGEQGFKEGVGLIAAMTSAQVLPVYLSGANTLFTWPDGLTNDTRLVIHAGELIEPMGTGGKESRVRIAQKIASALGALERDNLKEIEAG